MGLDVLFHEGNGTLTSGSGVLNEKLHCAQRIWERSAARRPDGMRDWEPAVRCFQLSSFLGSPMVCGMSDHVYKKLELVGSSTTTIEDAVQNALSLAAKTIRNMRWFEVIETRGHIEENKINHWQVTVKVGFTLER